VAKHEDSEAKKCDGCNGHGTVTVKGDGKNNESATQTVTCGKCKGSGKL
jgi:hypothetical protein